MGALADGGSRLQAFLDGLPVEQNWIAGHHVVWQTGQQNGPDGVGPESHTHCSAFVAAVALDLDIYVLRPPNHAQELLANAQVDWLGAVGDAPGPTAAAAGWQDLGRSDAADAWAIAVAAANAGRLVVAGYRQPATTNPVTGATSQAPGHIVVVRPQTGPVSAASGPQAIMAGERNWREVLMAAAFAAHPGAWPDAIRLFAHDTDLQADFGVTT